MFRRQDLGFDYRQRAVVEIVIVNFARDALFADILDSGCDMFVCNG